MIHWMTAEYLSELVRRLRDPKNHWPVSLYEVRRNSELMFRAADAVEELMSGLCISENQKAKVISEKTKKKVTAKVTAIGSSNSS